MKSEANFIKQQRPFPFCNIDFWAVERKFGCENASSGVLELVEHWGMSASARPLPLFNGSVSLFEKE